MKTKKSALIMIVLGALFTTSSCSVEYRARHPRPKPKRVIVVGKAGTEQHINTHTQQEQPATNVAVY
ncbi:hypothetical protein I5907_13700 [Panacibacter sp. DH6]|uniref:Uncharacterized protein n=1 Tax=Panacibacter microcysteis TaxID=2793269 RepID=A0A931GV14_9BACT|nr:hypothetical protein [Panacibacter microcysteis]MBG9377291.1 hypothetical protein [Panacibacter microcysteis]